MYICLSTRTWGSMRVKIRHCRNTNRGRRTTILCINYKIHESRIVFRVHMYCNKGPDSQGLCIYSRVSCGGGLFVIKPGPYKFKQGYR